jgi:predicted lipoprotein with Yx(FWY)xxD motif
MLRTGVQRALTLMIGAVAIVAMSASAAEAATHASTASVVSSVENSNLGPILAAGTTVYTLKPSKIGCTAACRRVWPPVLLPHGTKSATAGSGVDASKLGTVKAAKGARQITYAGKRLYWSAKDKAAGQVHGNVTNKWGKWSTVTAASTAAATTGAPTTGAPATEAPATAAPQTAPPETAAPETAPPATAAPQTAPPATQPPATQPPATQPKTTEPPGNGGVGF